MIKGSIKPHGMILPFIFNAVFIGIALAFSIFSRDNN